MLPSTIMNNHVGLEPEDWSLNQPMAGFDAFRTVTLMGLDFRFPAFNGHSLSDVRFSATYTKGPYY